MRYIIPIRRKDKVAIAVLFAAMALFPCPGLMADVQWKNFISSDGFSVRYPMDWFVRNPDIATGDLVIQTQKLGAAAILSRRAEGAIQVMVEDPGETLPHLLAQAGKSDPEYETRVLGQETLAAPGCDHVKAMTVSELVVTRQDVPKTAVVPPPQISTIFPCEKHGMIVLLKLVYWSDDRHKDSYRQTALKMLRTLRID